MNSNDIRRYNLNHNHNHNHNHNYSTSSSSSNVNGNYPSFSASLLEEIYRSIDDDKPRDSHSRRTNRVDRYVLEQWMEMEMEKEKLKIKEEKEKEKIVKYRRYSMPENGEFRRPLYYSSSTSSSDSSSGIGGFSSSDTDSMYGAPAKASTLRPIRTADFGRKCYSDDNSMKSKGKKDGKLQHALKLYADLKKVKQPISPGGKIASFLNSLFNSGNSKTPKKSKSSVSTSAMTSVSVPSTATSYSRSCLSKTPSSAGRYERRSVRFCPVSVVVDETGKTSVRNGVVSSSRMEVCGGDEELLKVEIREKQRRVEEAAKELLNNYRSNNNNLIRKEFKVNVISADNNTKNNKNNDDKRDFEDEDDDGESCCSSDLFELDNLLEIGVDDRYRQELPVYETTYVGTNRAMPISVARS